MKKSVISRILYRIQKHPDLSRDLAVLLSVCLTLVLLFSPFLAPGLSIFSDLDFASSSKLYMDQIVGLWNYRWSSPNFFNLPRLPMLLLPYAFSAFFGFSGEVFFKAFLFELIFLSASSMFILITLYLRSQTITQEKSSFMIAQYLGSLFYVLNPWFIIRIQHIYLLIGYALAPLVLIYIVRSFRFRDEEWATHDLLHEARISSKNILDLSILALLVSISTGSLHYFIFFVFIIIGAIIIFYLRDTIKPFFKKRYYAVRALSVLYLKRIFYLAFIGILMNAFWLLPYLEAFFTNRLPTQDNINTSDTLVLFSRHSSLSKVLLLASYWWPMIPQQALSWTFFVSGGLLVFFIFFSILLLSFRQRLLFFPILIIPFLILLGIGVYHPFLGNFYTTFVMKISILGNVFRDPNKILGFLALAYAFFLALGLHRYFELFVLHTTRQLLIKIFSAVFFMFLLGSYVYPFHNYFVLGFYAPLRIPRELSELKDKYYKADDPNSRVLILPTPESMVQSNLGIATPAWNYNNAFPELKKASGSFYVHDSPKNTIFHQEGNTRSLRYYLNFLIDVLDEGRTAHFDKLVQVLGVNEILYTDAYLGHSDRQKFHRTVLDSQSELKKNFEGDIAQIYTLKESLPKFHPIAHKIYTPYGYAQLESYTYLPHFNFHDFAVLFTNEAYKGSLEYSTSNDYIEVKDSLDLYLSNLDSSYYLVPFNAIEGSNSTIDWGRAYVNSESWLWDLKSKNLFNRYPFEHDMGFGLAVTSVGYKLALPAYQRAHTNGTRVFDFNAILFLDHFFKTNNPSLYEINPLPSGKQNKLATLSGELQQGDPRENWQIAQTGFLRIRDNTPYRFYLDTSGRYADRLHMKVRFYDEHFQEQMLSYISNSTESFEYNHAQFYGEAVSPPSAHFMRLELLTMQNPETKSYWWIHDIEIQDLSAYSEPNTFTLEKSFSEETTADVYARVLVSNQGGEIRVEHTESQRSFDMSTQISGESYFSWIPLGSFDFVKGNNHLHVQNLTGFNAVNVLAVIPQKERQRLFEPTRKTIQRANVFTILEAENDFNQSNLPTQSLRTYSNLSRGRGITGHQGLLNTQLSIVKSAEYYLHFRLHLPLENTSSLKVKILNIDNEAVYDTTISSLKKITPQKSFMGDFKENPLSDHFFTLVENKENLQNLGEVQEGPIFLKEGYYRMLIEFDSNMLSLANTSNFRPFDPSQVRSPRFEASLSQGCSTCESIVPSMMRYENNGSALRMFFEPSCSCDWYSFSSPRIAIKPMEEYYVTLNTRSQYTNQRHNRILFVNDKSEIVGSHYISEINEKFHSQWSRYQEIFKSPPEATAMFFQMWTRGNPDHTAWIDLDELFIAATNEFPTLDTVTITEGSALSEFFNRTTTQIPFEYENSWGSSEYITSLRNPENKLYLLHLAETTSRQRAFIQKNPSLSAQALSLNGVSSGFIGRDEEQGTVIITLENLYLIGFLGIPLSLVLSGLLWQLKKRQEAKN